jgi:hypothetical protein
VFSLVPSPLMVVIIASAMPAAINPYSIAVAPDSSARNLRKVFMEGKHLPRILTNFEFDQRKLSFLTISVFAFVGRSRPVKAKKKTAPKGGRSLGRMLARKSQLVNI